MRTAKASTHPRITAVILAGGAGTRMNSSEKALLQWRGRSFIEHLVDQLQLRCTSIALNTNSSPELFESFGLPLLRDPFLQRRGPLAGILAALNFSQTEFTLVVPCDSPLLPDNLADRLLQGLIGSSAAIAYAHCAGDDHYLYALLRNGLCESLSKFMRADDVAVRRWYQAEGAVAVNFNAERDHFFNINTSADLAQLPT